MLKKLHSLFLEEYIREGLRLKIWDNPDANSDLYQIWEEAGLNPLPYMYYIYLQYLLDPGNHNYPLLREFLYMYSKTVLAPEMLLKLHWRKDIQDLDDRHIKYIIDVGCGHSGYWDMFSVLFRECRIIGVDKDEPMLNMMKDHPNFDSFYKYDFLDFMECHQKILSPEHTLFFFSDMLHCKEHNIEFLQHVEGKYPVLVNEHRYDPYFNIRMKKFGGGLISELYFSERDYVVELYSDSHYFAWRNSDRA